MLTVLYKQYLDQSRQFSGAVRRAGRLVRGEGADRQGASSTRSWTGSRSSGTRPTSRPARSRRPDSARASRGDMAISYHIYANDGRGGDVDYSTPIATTTALTFTVGPLVAPSDNTFAVRAFDATSGIEEANTDARVRVVIDPAGNDVTARPNPVNGLSARRTAGGTCWVSWGYDATGQGGPPSRFDVTMTPGPGEPRRDGRLSAGGGRLRVLALRPGPPPMPTRSRSRPSGRRASWRASRRSSRSTTSSTPWATSTPWWPSRRLEGRLATAVESVRRPDRFVGPS